MTTMLGLQLTGRRVLVVGGGPVAARRVQSLLADAAAGGRGRPAAVRGAAGPAPLGADRVARARGRGGRPRRRLAGAHGHGRPRDRRGRRRRGPPTRQTFCVDAGDGVGGVGPHARRPPSRATCSWASSRPARPDPRRTLAVRDAVATQPARGARRPAAAAGPHAGRVVLVGGGPGDVGLLTLAGRRALAEADVVVTDRLGPVAVLDELAPGVEIIDVGKTPGHHPVPQHEIGRILVEQAQRGRVVVRLKGGDPFVYGRGGEEVLACREADVAVEVIPGVSSAFAAPAAAGIPLTHRGHGRRRARDERARRLVVAPRSRACGTRSCTVVVLMGVSALADAGDRGAGRRRRPATPVALVEEGTLPGQRVTRARLDDVVDVAASAGVRAPAVIVLGRGRGGRPARARPW